MSDLDEILEYLAVELLGWERLPDTVRPPRKMAPLETWKHPDGTTSYGSGTKNHLLTGNGNREVVAAMLARRFDYHADRQGASLDAPGCWVEFVDMDLSITYRSKSGDENFQETVCRAAYQALRGEGHG